MKIQVDRRAETSVVPSPATAPAAADYSLGCSLFLGEQLTLLTGISALLVLLCVAPGQRSRLHPA